MIESNIWWSLKLGGMGVSYLISRYLGGNTLDTVMGYFILSCIIDLVTGVREQ